MARQKIDLLGTIPPNSTLTGIQGGNLGYVTNPVSQNQNLGSDVDKENPENQMKAMDARNEQNAKKMMSLNFQQKDAELPNTPIENTLPTMNDIKVGGSAESSNTYIPDSNRLNFATKDSAMPNSDIKPLGDAQIKTIDGNSINGIETGGNVNPETGKIRSALDTILDDARNRRAEIDADYAKRLNRQRMFQALYKGLSALTQLPGAVVNGNSPLKEDNTIFNAMDTELGRRWQQNRSDVQSDTARSIENLRNQHNLSKWDREQSRLEAKQKNEEEKTRINAEKTKAQIAHWAALDDVAKSKLSNNELQAELIQAKIAVQNATEQMRFATTEKAYSDAQATMIRANAYAQNVQDLISKRGTGNVVTTEQLETDPITGEEKKKVTTKTTQPTTQSGSTKTNSGNKQKGNVVSPWKPANNSKNVLTF